MNDERIQVEPRRRLPVSSIPTLPKVPEGSQRIDSRPGFWSVFLAWEQLRFVYNVLMLLVFLAHVNAWMRLVAIVPFAIVYFVIVNVPFCFCHVFEIYFCWMGLRRGFVRFGIFTSITLVVGGFFVWLLFMP